MINLEYLVTALIVVLIPGTGVIYTVSIGLVKGSRASVYVAIGCTLGIIPSLLACILGLATVFHTSALLFECIKFAGVAYLLHLAWCMYKDNSVITLDASDVKTDGIAILVKGCLINILNPKLSIFFMAFLPQFVSGNTHSATLQMFSLGAVFMLLTFAVFVIYGLLAHILGQYVVNSPKVIKRVQNTFSASFALLAALLALTENSH